MPKPVIHIDGCNSDELATESYGGVRVIYRKNSTDSRGLAEVITRNEYSRKSIGFAVEEGEHWLDLGANIGAFAVYCKLRGATCDCYEPDRACFEILRYNAHGMLCVNAAVSASHKKTLKFYVSVRKRNYYRGTLVGGSRQTKESGEVCNLHVSKLNNGQEYDGIKMDIEGGEFALLDGDLLPLTEKLCFEYHTSRDTDMSRLKSRIKFLRDRYEVVSYQPDLDRIMVLGGQQMGFADRKIYCLGLK